MVAIPPVAAVVGTKPNDIVTMWVIHQLNPFDVFIVPSMVRARGLSAWSVMH